MSPIYHSTRQSIHLSVYKMLEHTKVLKNHKYWHPSSAFSLLRLFCRPQTPERRGRAQSVYGYGKRSRGGSTVRRAPRRQAAA